MEPAIRPEHPWVEEVFERWPGPIAHEVHRLRELMEAGDVVASVWQLKDVAEVLVKLPAVVLARDVTAHSGDEVLAARVRATLLGRPPTLGAWFTLAADVLAPWVRRSPAAAALLVPEAAALFRDAGGKRTPLADLLLQLVEWRNEELGHGAFRLDLAAYRRDLARLAGDLNLRLGEAATVVPWTDARLVPADGAGGPLLGHGSLRARHEALLSLPHVDLDVPLRLVRGDRCLDLAPWLGLRRCSVCDRQEVFLFNSWDGKPLGRVCHLDYREGHALSLPVVRDAHLRGELSQLREAPAGAAPPEGLLGEEHLRRSTRELLERTDVESDYLPPNHLREWVSRFVEAHDRGLLWLRAPAHTGKTVFAAGLARAARAEGEAPLQRDLVVACFHVKREYVCFPPQLRAFLDERLPSAEILDIAASRGSLPTLDLGAEDPAGATARLLEQLLAISRRVGRHEKRLLLCVDGLDELREGEGRSIADFLPRPDQLPEGVYLLVTSRPEGECAPWIWARACALASGAGPSEISDTDLADPGSPYRRLLRRYFDGRLRSLLLRLLDEELQRSLADGGGSAGGARLPQEIRPAVEETWRDLLRRTGRLRDGEAAPPLPGRAVQAALDRFDRLFDLVLDRSERLFLYAAHLVRLLEEETLSVAEIADLPTGARLLQRHLERLRRLVGGKPQGLLERVLLVLAAAEEAHATDASWQPAGFGDPEWRGLPLDLLAGLVDEPPSPSGGLSTRLVFVLQSLRELLRSWRGAGSAQARYRLGLKDVVGALREISGPRLDATHRRLAKRCIDDLEYTDADGSPDGGAAAHRLHSCLAHAVRSADGATLETVLLSMRFNEVLGARAFAAVDRSHGREAIAWFSLSCARERVVRALLEPRGEWRPELRNDLAAVYMNRGNARANQGDLGGAIEDYGEAIELRECVRALLEPRGEWRPELRNDLAAAYMNRGIARANQGDLGGAIEDYGEAIERMEGVRALLEPRGEWRPELRNSLAAAYMNRGVARSDQGDLGGAIEDYGEAIERMEGVRALLEPRGRWTPWYRQCLCKAYRNRGLAYRAAGETERAQENLRRAAELLGEAG